MRLATYGFTLLCAFLFSQALMAQETITDKSTGEVFPREISFEHAGKKYDLKATGVATRKKLIIKVYSIAHYLQKGADITNGDRIQAILSDDNAKQFTIKWVRDVGVDKIQEAFQESFHRVFPGQDYAQMSSHIDNFLQLFKQEAHKGDTYVLRWIPGGYVEVLINDQKVGSISNENFARGLWNIWLGSDKVVNRNDLISQMK